MKINRIYKNLLILLISFMVIACTPTRLERTNDDKNSTQDVQITATFEQQSSTVVVPTLEISNTPLPTATFSPIISVGSKANLTSTDDFGGIEGIFEIVSMTKIQVSEMLFTVIEAPGVEIRLGNGKDFTDEASVSLKDITGVTLNYRDFSITIPDEAFDGRTFNSIGIVCYDNGDVFDFAIFDSP